MGKKGVPPGEVRNFRKITFLFEFKTKYPDFLATWSAPIIYLNCATRETITAMVFHVLDLHCYVVKTMLPLAVYLVSLSGGRVDLYFNNIRGEIKQKPSRHRRGLRIFYDFCFVCLQFRENVSFFRKGVSGKSEIVTSP